MQRHSLIFTIFSAISCASAINSEFAYQDYLDFGANRGRFIPGASGLEITSKDASKSVSLNAPMPDFSAANGRLNPNSLIKGETTAIGDNFIITAAHMISKDTSHGALIIQGAALSFDGVNSRIIDSSRSFSDYNGGASGIDSWNADFAVLMADKIPLVNPAAYMQEDFYTNKFDQTLDDKNRFINSNNYSQFARAGTGVQLLSDKAGAVYLANARNFFTGGLTGFAMRPNGSEHGISMIDFSSTRTPFSSVLAQGDSGSALYGYNSAKGRWEVVAVASSTSCKGDSNNVAPSDCSWSSYHLVNPNEIELFKRLHEINVNANITSDGAKLTSDNIKLATRLHQSTSINEIANMGLNELIINDPSNQAEYEKTIATRDDFDKNLIIKGGDEFKLDANTNLGASALNINVPTYKISGRYDFVHAGLNIAKNSSVEYEATTPAGDNLHVVGEGELKILNPSAGGLRLGGARTELAKGVSFKDIYLTNQAKLVLNDDVSLNNIKINAGTLDINGHNVEITPHKQVGMMPVRPSQVQEFDANLGAKIISNLPASINISKDMAMHANINGAISLNHSHKGEFIYDNGFDVINLNASSLNLDSKPVLALQGQAVLHGYIPKTAIISNALNEDVYKEQIRANQNDWITKEYKAQNANINNIELKILRNSSVKIDKLIAQNSSINIAEPNVYVHLASGENLLNYLNHQIKPSYELSEAKDIDVTINNLDLKSSNLNINKANFNGQITADEASKISLNSATVLANINAANLDAKNTTFIFDNSQINVSKSTTGANNKMIIAKDFKPKNVAVLLASLSNDTPVPKEYFKPVSAQDGAFSELVPNIKFEQVGNTSKWYLEKIQDENPAPITPPAETKPAVPPITNPEPATPPVVTPPEQPTVPEQPPVTPPIQPQPPVVQPEQPAVPPVAPQPPVTPPVVTPPSQPTPSEPQPPVVQPEQPAVPPVAPQPPVIPAPSKPAPTVPNKPILPANPAPEQPSNPAPEQPAQPTKPSKPANPAPSIPTKPVLPTKPEQPSVPAQPSKPNKIDYDPAHNKDNTESAGFYKDYFFVKENTRNIKEAKSSLNQIFYAHVLEWNNLFKRMGELRANNGSAGTWAKLLAGASRYENAAKTKFYELQAGFDKRTEFSSGVNFSGAMLSLLKMNPRSENILNGDIKGTGFGLYSSWIFDNGYYFDAIVKYSRFKNNFDMSFNNTSGTKAQIQAKNKASNIIASAELGRRIAINKSLYVEPSAEIISGHVGAQKITNAAAHLELKSSSFTPLSTKLALAIGQQPSEANALGWRLQAAWAQDLARSASKEIRDLNVIRRILGERDGRLILNAAASYQMAKNTTINFEFERSFMGKMNMPYVLNFTIRKEF